MTSPLLQRLLVRRRVSGAFPIGVDFALDRLHLVQLQPADAVPKVRAAVSIPYPTARDALFADRRALRKFVAGALARAPFAGRRIYSTLPVSDVRIVPLTIACGPGKDEQREVMQALNERLRINLANMVIDYLPVRGAENTSSEKQVLAAVAERASVEAFLDLLHAVGFDPVALDIGPAALARLLAAMQGEHYDQSVLLLNTGLEKSFLTVIWGRRLMLDREIEFGEARLVNKLSRALGLSPEVALSLLQQYGVAPRASAPAATLVGSDAAATIAEVLHAEFAALAEEIGRTLVYIASRTHGSSARCIHISGSAARYPQFVERLQELMGLPVNLLDPFTLLQPVNAAAIPEALDPAGGIALAAGLALRRES